MKDLILHRISSYKELGDQTLAQLTADDVFWQYNIESNSIATIVKHITANMISGWTNFLTEDSEKSWRDPDAEFENNLGSKEEMLQIWEKGWRALFDSLNQITEENIHDIILIRGEKLTVVEALLSEVAHYSYHIGQIIYAAKIIKNEEWKTLSIAKHKSQDYNNALPRKDNPEDIQQNASPVCYANDPEVRDEYKIEIGDKSQR